MNIPTETADSCPFCRGTGVRTRREPQFRALASPHCKAIAAAVVQSEPGTLWMMKDFFSVAPTATHRQIYNAVNYLTMRKMLTRAGYGKFETPERSQAA